MSAKATTAPAATGASYYDLLPKPPTTTLLLSHDEVVSLLRARGYTSAADDLEAERAGPAWRRWRGERRFDWWTVWHWGRDYRSIHWEPEGAGDGPSPEVPAAATATTP